MVKVAAAQIKATENIKENLEKILYYIEKAKSENADIVCFCEITLNLNEKKRIDISKELSEIQAKCRDKSIYCIFGSYTPEKEGIKNTIFLIDRSGNIKYKYYKVHLWISEKDEITPGKTNRVVKTDFGKIGIITCWDFAFPSFIQKLSKKGAKIIFCPTYLADSEKDAEAMRAIPLVRAFENLSYYISCDAYTDETLSESYICSPLKILNSIKKEEGIIFADLNLSEIDSLRDYYDHLR